MSSGVLAAAPSQRPAHVIFQASRRALAVVEVAIPATLYVALILLVGADVMGRYLFNSPFTGTGEWTSVAVVWIVCIGMTRAAAVRTHVGISILLDRLPDRFQHAASRSIDAVTSLICFAAALVAWRLVDATRSRELPLTGFPTFWVNIAAPIGFALCGVHYLLSPEPDPTAIGEAVAEAQSDTPEADIS